MTFLNPAVLFGLLAASIPILLHFLNLRKLKKVEFSSLRFLKQLQKQKIKKLKLKQLLLLLLRIAIILFFVTAFARPTLESISLGGAASAAKTTAVIILDDTFSMQVIEPNGSRFNQAKEKISEILNNLQEGDEAVVVRVSNISNDLPLLTNDISKIQETLPSVSVSHVSGTLNNAIIKAAKILAASYNFNKELYIFSDFQKSRFSEEDLVPDLSELLTENIKLYSLPLHSKDVYNLAITDISVDTRIIQKNRPIRVSGVVSNYSNQTVNNAVVSLYINGQRSSQKSISLEEGASGRITLEANVEQTGFQEIYLEIEEDDILLDNRRYANFVIPEKITVGLFTEVSSDSRFIELALSASDSDNSLDIDKKRIEQINSLDLSVYDMIFVVGAPSDVKPVRLMEFIKNGGGLFLFPGTATTKESFVSFCNELQITAPTKLVSYEETTEAIQFGTIDYNHPLFTDLFDDNRKKKIESPEFYEYFKIFPQGKGNSIITYPDNSAFLCDYTFGNGTILQAAVSPVPDKNNFPLKSMFAPLVYKSVYYLSAQEKTVVDAVAGEIVSVPLNISGVKQVTVTLPNKGEIVLNAEKRNTKYVSFSETELVGNYKFSTERGILSYIAVNTEPLESVTKPIEDDEFSNYLKEIGFTGTHIELAPDVSIQEILEQARYGSELWKLFLIIALLLAIIETLVSRSAKKDIVELKQ